MDIGISVPFRCNVKVINTVILPNKSCMFRTAFSVQRHLMWKIGTTHQTGKVEIDHLDSLSNRCQFDIEQTNRCQFIHPTNILHSARTLACSASGIY